MSDLLNTTVIRPAQSLSPKAIAAVSYQTHSEEYQSDRYKKWLQYSLKLQSKELNESMHRFVHSKHAFINVDDFEDGFKEILQFCAYNAYDFSISDFAVVANSEKLSLIFIAGTKEDKEAPFARISKKSNYYKIRQVLEDIICVQMIANFTIPQQFDASLAFKALELSKQFFLSKNSASEKVSIKRLFAKPIVLNLSALIIDPCANKPSIPSEDSSFTKSNTADKESKKHTDTPCECKCDETCVHQDPCCVDVSTYVAELFVVKDAIHSYEPAEISYIENVLQSEIRERKHSQLQREEIFSEHEEEISSFEEKEHQTDDKYSLHKEVDKVINKELSLDAGVTATYTGGATIVSSTNVSSNTARNDARKLVLDQSKSVINKAVSSLEKKVRTLTTHKTTNEIVEKNKHTFGGTEGATEDISRQFYYVNLLRKAQVYSHGIREIIDINLPEPAALYKRLLEIPFDKQNPGEFALPVPDCSKITRDNYKNLISQFAINNAPEPAPQPANYNIYQPVIRVDKNDVFRDEEIIIPAGYVATSMSIVDCHVTMHHKVANLHHRINLKLGSGMVQISRGNDDDENYEVCSSTLSVSGSSIIYVTPLGLKDFNLTLKLTLTAEPVDLSSWKEDICALLNEAYNKKQEEHKQEVEAFIIAKTEHQEAQQKLKQEKYNQHPFIMSQIIKEQLQQAVISYISCQFFDDNDAMKNNVEPCGYPQMSLREAKKEGEFVRFFENAFEWKFMNYVLYPSFWARKCTWKTTTQDEGSMNHLFTKFLQAGSARVSITVRPGFEDLVRYFLKHRKIWGYSGVPAVSGPEYLPIIQELKENKNNFNADREGSVTWLDTNSAIRNEVILSNNDDYFHDIIDPITNQPSGQFTFDPQVDINREISIDCIIYKIVNIEQRNGQVVIILDRDLEERCDQTFEAIYQGVVFAWSTGAIFVGAAWIYKAPTSLVWLRENARCLPCSYPIKCEE